MGLLERHGPKVCTVACKTECIVAPNTRKYRLHAEVHDAVRHGATVYSRAELKSYDDLDATYVRDVINHAETYVQRVRSHERDGELLVGPRNPQADAQGHVRASSSSPIPSVTVISTTGLPVQQP